MADPFAIEMEAEKLQRGKGTPEALSRVDNITRLIGELMGPLVPGDHRRRVAAQIVTSERAAIAAWYDPQTYQVLLTSRPNDHREDGHCIEYLPSHQGVDRRGALSYSVTREQLVEAMISRFCRWRGAPQVVEAFSRHMNHAALLGTKESEQYYADPGLYNHPEVAISAVAKPWTERDAFAVARAIVAEYRAFPRELRPTAVALPFALKARGDMVERICRRLKVVPVYDINLDTVASKVPSRAVFLSARPEHVKFRVYPLDFLVPQIEGDAITFPAVYGWTDTELLDPRAVRYVDGV